MNILALSPSDARRGLFATVLVSYSDSLTLAVIRHCTSRREHNIVKSLGGIPKSWQKLKAATAVVGDGCCFVASEWR